jgi:hypothetical protein
MQTTRNQSSTVACRLLCVTALLVLAVAPQALSQSGGIYDLSWNTIDGGGSTFATGGAYSLGGTTGQPDAGASSGGAYALTGGFWGIGHLLPPVPMKILSLNRLTNGQVFLQCLGVPSQVNNLQVSPGLSSGSFATVSPPPAAADATGAFSYQDVAATGTTKRFYRLIYP